MDRKASIRLLLLVLFVMATCPARAVNGLICDSEGVPDGLSSSDWAGIRGAYQAQRHTITHERDRYHAHNPGQQWQIQFDERGFVVKPQKGNQWSWGLELRSYGRPSEEQALPPSKEGKANGQDIVYQRSDYLYEWFVNDERGLEHGLTIAARPHGDGEKGAPLQFTFAVRGNLRPIISSDAIQFVDQTGTSVVSYAGLQVWDAEGRKIPARFTATDDGFTFRVEDADARYPLTIDPIAQQAYLKASNTGAGDQFGRLVAISGDTVVVGAPFEASAAVGVNGNQSDNSASSAGAAYVFVRSGGTWTQQAYLKASNTGASDSFGSSVAISGDTAIVGATGEASANGNQSDNSAGLSGAAYVFVRSGSTWTQQAYLKASNIGATDFFGDSVAISGDTAIVGALGEASANGNQSDNSANLSGAAYVFVRSGGTWTQQAYLKASNIGGGDFFGTSVAISGDTAIVGASFEDSAATGVNGPQSDNSATDSGAAYVFVRSGINWTQQAYLKASNTGASDLFGTSVAISGDTAIVGAERESSSATGVNNNNQSDNSLLNSGAAYVFVRSGNTWTQQAYVKASNTGAGDSFGSAVAIAGDTAIVGARDEDSAAVGFNGNQADDTATQSGAAYVFVRSGSNWTQQAYVKASNTEANDAFGTSVAISGDTTIVGARTEDSAVVGVNKNQSDNSASNSGAAYVFNGLPATAPLQNISTRVQVLTGANVLIGGFIIGGTGNKDLLVRGLGATLGDNGVTGFLSDPTLDLRDTNQAQIATNDNWKVTQQAVIQATGKAPHYDSESAILRTFAPGKYTVILAGKNNTTGVGLVDFYDQNPASTAQLTNISSRGFVGTNSTVMIGGFITGVAENRVIVRVLGPTLMTRFGITGALMNPVLGLFDANGNAIASNDNWQQSSQMAEIQGSGFAPPDPAEPAIISIRSLGNTTAVVSGKNGTTGVALIEVYKLP